MLFLKTYESFNKPCYYRAESEFVGDNIKLKPSGYYEMVGKNNKPVFMFDEYKESNIPELCASKYIGGCVIGSFSMNRKKEFYIYEICENPDVDISNWIGGDFEYLEEVRYRHSVTGKYLGKVILSDYQKKLFQTFYKHFEFKSDDSDSEEMSDKEIEEFDKYWDDIENGKLTKELKKIKCKI